MIIKVLGGGCANCQKTKALVVLLHEWGNMLKLGYEEKTFSNQS
jgi:hypothetical protein